MSPMVERYAAILAEFRSQSKWFIDDSWHRFTALTAMTCADEPAAVAEGVRTIAARLEELSGWFGDLSGSLRFIVAAALLQRGISADALMAEIERTKALFRAENLWRGGEHEVIAILILTASRGGPTEAEDVARLAAIYRQIKKQQWWITNHADYPSCALLVPCEGDPEAVADRTIAIYEALKATGLRSGNTLQTATHLLATSQGAPAELASRFHGLFQAFRDRGTKLNSDRYDEVATLSLLKIEEGTVVEKVQEQELELQALRPKLGSEVSFNVACSVALLELTESESARAESLVTVQSALDLISLLQTQAAMVAVVAGGGAAASAGSS